MKKYISFLFTIIVYLNVSAQDYVPMAIDSATWFLGYKDENPQFNNLIAMRLEGDTIVNNLTYLKIYHYSYSNIGIKVSSRKLFGLIRDDVDERKVFGGFINETQNEFEEFVGDTIQCNWGEEDNFIENLLYDFSIDVGDTLNACMYNMIIPQ